MVLMTTCIMTVMVMVGVDDDDDGDDNQSLLRWLGTLLPESRACLFVGQKYSLRVRCGADRDGQAQWGKWSPRSTIRTGPPPCRQNARGLALLTCGAGGWQGATAQR